MVPASSNFLATCRLELLEPTHRGLHRFVPRHSDEVEVDIGDPVYVQREADDLWCEGRSESSRTMRALIRKRLSQSVLRRRKMC